jgi:hypothetical protein
MRREVAGGEVKRDVPVLEVEGRGAIIVIQNALLDRNVAGLQIEEAVQRGLARFSWLAGLRLVGRAVGVDDQVQLGPEDDQFAQGKMRNPESHPAPRNAHLLNLCVGRFAGSFKAMDDHAVRLGLQAEKMPVEGADLDPPAGGRLQFDHH